MPQTMINLVEKFEYSSVEEYKEARKQMVRDIEEHNNLNPDPEYNPNYREDFIKSVSGLRIKSEESNLP